jgi:chaperonin cofactor prefoldin
VIFLFDIGLLFFMAFAGGIVAIVGFFFIVSQRMSEPRKELEQRVEHLEDEIKELKNRK